MKRKPYTIKYEKAFINKTTFRRQNDWTDMTVKRVEISTGGADMGPHVYLLDETDDFALVYSPSYKAWEGMSSPWSDQPAAYYLCRKERELRSKGMEHNIEYNWIHFLACVHPGLYFRKAIEVMHARMVELQIRMDKKEYSTESEDQMYKIWNEEHATKE